MQPTEYKIITSMKSCPKVTYFQKRDRFTHPSWVSLNFIPTAVYGTFWWSLRAWNSSNCVTVSILNQYFALHVFASSTLTMVWNLLHFNLLISITINFWNVYTLKTRTILYKSHQSDCREMSIMSFCSYSWVFFCYTQKKNAIKIIYRWGLLRPFKS